MMLSAPIYRLKSDAKRKARLDGIPLHAALDLIAQAEGFAAWSHLSQATQSPAKEMLNQLKPRDLVLLAARPGQGKTLLAVALAVAAVRAGRDAFLFSLDYTQADVLTRLRDLDVDPQSLGDRFHVDTSDAICADYISGHIAGAAPGSVVVIDYLQLLDQRRSLPDLDTQISVLHGAARRLGVIMVIISQIDRTFDVSAKDMPGWDDIRMPNPVSLDHFDVGCFLQGGRVMLDRKSSALT